MATALLTGDAASSVFKTMDDRLEQLAIEAKQYSLGTSKGQFAFTQLVDEILRSRSMSRPLRGQPLCGIYLEIYQALRDQLLGSAEEAIARYNPRLSIRKWANHWRILAFRTVLTDRRLQTLALNAQNPKPNTRQQQQYALRELVEAIRLSGQLCRPHQGKFTPNFYELLYEESVNQTLIYVCKHIHLYDPKRGKKFMTWVNFRLDKLVIESRREFSPPQHQSIPSLSDLDQLVQPEAIDFSNCIRECIEEDADNIFQQKHIRHRPDANFQAIALATLSGKTWEEISTDFDLEIPTLSSFFRRCCQKFAPNFKEYLSP